MRLVYFSLSWVLGIWLESQWGVPFFLLLAALGACLLLAAFCRLCKKGGFLLIVCCCLFLGGMLRFDAVSWGDELQSYRGFFSVCGVVCDDPDVRDDYTVLRLSVSRVGTDGEWREVSGTALAYVSRYLSLQNGRDFPYYRYGDMLQMEGELQDPFQNEEFDFKAYLARKGVYSVISRPTGVTLLDEGKGVEYKERLYRFRGEMIESLDSALSEPQCSLSEAMLLGRRGSLSAELRQDFSRSGTSHLLAISGVHVSIIAGMSLSTGVWLFGRRRPYYFWLALTVVWGYVLLTGMHPSAMRAGFMVSLWLYSNRIGRPHSASTALVFAAAVMLAFDPKLLGDVGFQLSFTAMAGLIFLTPRFRGWGYALFGGDARVGISPVHSFVVGSFSVTLGAIAATLPLIAYYFETISLTSLPATFLALPAVPGVILSSAMTALAGLFCGALAGMLGWITWIFAGFVIEVAQFFSGLSFASVEMKASAPLVGGYYFVLAGLIWLPSNRGVFHKLSHRLKAFFRAGYRRGIRVPATVMIVFLLIVSALVWTANFTASDDRLHISVLDVGQGDAILISRGETQILIDGGPSPESLADQLGGELPFWDRKIELVVLTHPDADHLTGLLDVLRRYEVSKILTGGREVDTELYHRWRDLIDQKGIERVVAQKGQRISLGSEIEMTVLHPSGKTDYETVNDCSVVMRLCYGRFSMLLTGDIEEGVEESLIAGEIKSSVLKVAHHGSDTSTGIAFLDRVDPLLAVISVGAENKFGHPSEVVISRLEDAVGSECVFETSLNGTIKLVTDGEMLWLK